MASSRRHLLAAISAVALLLAFPSSAAARITGPCNATLGGEPVDAGHDSASTAIDVDYRDTIPLEGTVSGGTATSVDYKLTVAGISGSLGDTVAISSDRRSWSGSATVKDYAWAAVGLYEVTGTAATSAGPCVGTVYVCVTGKNPVTTVAGGVGAGLGFLGVLGIARGLLTRSPVSAARTATRTGVGGLIGALGGAVMLQQSCVMPLTIGMLVGAPLGGGALMGTIGLLFGRGTPRIVTPPEPEKERPREKTKTVYQFTAPLRSCAACRSHAHNRVYATLEVMNRPHPGCRCTVTSYRVDDDAYASYFDGGSVYDVRQPQA